MSMTYFVTSHPNPANHFVTFASELDKQQMPFTIVAATSVADRFTQFKEQHSIIVFNPENTESDFFEKLTWRIAKFTTLITDISEENRIPFLSRLSTVRPDVEIKVYYDNPETFVPGGYSEIAAKIINYAQSVMFSNAHHLHTGVEQAPHFPIDLSTKRKFGLGYYPLIEGEKILKIRENAALRETLRMRFCEKNHFDPSQDLQIVVYVGGANEAYFEAVFPHFVQQLSTLATTYSDDFANTVIVLQQHPRAREQGDRDGQLLEGFNALHSTLKNIRFIRSQEPTTEVLGFCDAVLYSQTSMAPQFVFGGVPQVAQMGPEPYRDVLLSAGYPFISKPDELGSLFKRTNLNQGSVEKLRDSLGMHAQWSEKLIQAITETTWTTVSL